MYQRNISPPPSGSKNKAGTRNHWVPALCPSSGILNTRKHNFRKLDLFSPQLGRETGSVSLPSWGGREDTCSVGPLKKPKFNHRRIHVQSLKILYDCRSVCLGIEHACETCDQILLPFRMLLSEICGLISVGRPLWQEDESAVCSAIAQWSESHRTRNHTLLSSSETPPTWRARLPYLYPPGTGCPSYTPDHWVPFMPYLTTHRATVEVF
jgi:hypothetical protein